MGKPNTNATILVVRRQTASKRATRGAAHLRVVAGGEFDFSDGIMADLYRHLVVAPTSRV